MPDSPRHLGRGSGWRQQPCLPRLHRAELPAGVRPDVRGPRTREPESEADLNGDPRRFMAAHKTWKRAERSETTDAAFMAEVRRTTRPPPLRGGPWRRSFGLSWRTRSKWTSARWCSPNLARCRQQLGKGSAETLAMNCQQQFLVAELVGVVRPAAVLVCMLGADPSRGQVGWEAPDWRATCLRLPRILVNERPRESAQRVVAGGSRTHQGAPSSRHRLGEAKARERASALRGAAYDASRGLSHSTPLVPHVAAPSS